MRLIFAGTPEFAARSLAALARAGHKVVLALTQPDRPAGRGLRPQPSAVKRLALELGIPVETPATLKSPGVCEGLARFSPDALVVAAYGLIIPAEVLAIPRLGGLNVHASLLPRWRGAAPIHRAILAGDAETGISIMQMDAGLDTGDVLLQAPTPVLDTDTAGSLHDRLADLGAGLLVTALERATTGGLARHPQDSATATYAAKIVKTEACLDWWEPAAAVWRRVRAFNPAPGATTQWRGEAVKIWAARPVAPAIPRADGTAADDRSTDQIPPSHIQSGQIQSEPIPPGRILSASRRGLTVACGDAALELLELQRPGGKRLPAAAFVASTGLAAGESFA